MDEDIAIIDRNTRNEKIKNFFNRNKKLLILVVSLILLLLMGYFVLDEYKSKKKIEISDKYNSIVIEYSKNNNKERAKNGLIKLVNKKDSTYSPLSLYFIIDNELINEYAKVNKLFDVLIDDISLDQEIKNLIIYKKGLYNADNMNENQLLSILNPIINSKSVWKPHALYLMAEYFYFKDEKQKSKEFFNQILILDNVNQDLRIEVQKRLNRDLSE